MTIEVIKFGFVAGELAPAFYGRPDLEKFDFGLARAYNWFVDYRGGLSSRPGMLFNEFIKHDNMNVRLFEFKFNTELGNTYIMMFGDEYIRFVQNGSYILENEVEIQLVSLANPGVVTAAGHGFANGDWVKFPEVGGMVQLRGRTAIVAGRTTNTFQLKDHNGANINTTTYGTFSEGTVARIYTKATPYASANIPELCVSQFRDYVTITQRGNPPYILTRIDDTNWTLAEETFGTTMPKPAAVTTSASVDENSGATYTVTAVSDEGEESLPAPIALEKDGPKFDTAGERVGVHYSHVSNAQYYNIYRSLWSSSGATSVSGGEDLGYIGRAFGVQFIDDGIIPDFTKTPPVSTNPFAERRIEFVNITASGTGYTPGNTITVTDAGGGTGFVGTLIVSASGAVAGVKVTNGGSGYVTPVAVITAGGTGATFSFVISPSTGMWPGLNTNFQQRKIYAASDNDPLTIWGSKPGLFRNFDVSSIVAENDAYEFELDSGELTPIKHLMAVRGGMLALTESGIWVVNGGGDNTAITPTNVLADPHTFIGCSDVRPIRIDTDLIYVEHKGFTARQLEYNDFSKLYSGIDISILSHHFFTREQKIISWAYSGNPYKLIWGAKADGKFLSLTIVKDQKVYAWCEHGTKGFVEEFITMEEDGRDVVYCIVERFINGSWNKYLESLATDTLTHVEDAVVMDSALTLGATNENATLSADTTEGFVEFTASASVFSSFSGTKILRMAGGKAEVTYTDANTLEGTWIRNPTQLIPETTPPKAIPGAIDVWTLDTPVQNIYGLHHLEGETVQVLADGNRLADQVVGNGSIFLEREATRVSVGLPFESIAQSLPLTITGEVIEGQRKRVPQIAVRLLESRGLKCGRSLDKLYSMKERTTEPMGEPTNLQNGMKLLSVQPRWDEGGQMYFYRNDPTPVSILGYVTSIEVGDDPG